LRVPLKAGGGNPAIWRALKNSLFLSLRARQGVAIYFFMTGLLRRLATCGTPRPAKRGNILAALNTFSVVSDLRDSL